MSRRIEEYRSCTALIQWWGYAHRVYGLPEFALYHVANQGGGSAKTGHHLKLMGQRAGVPDYWLMAPRGPYCGLAIEMKTDIGKTSPAQKEFLSYLNEARYLAQVCKGSGEARELIEQYLALPKPISAVTITGSNTGKAVEMPVRRKSTRQSA